MSNRREYVTLFDKNYLTFGITMYESLQRHSTKDFRLTALAMDEETAHFLKTFYPEINTASLQELVDKDIKLLKAIGNRGWKELCWTMGSYVLSLMLWDHDEVTYLDSDIYFFADPEFVFQEIPYKAAASIVPHNFPEHDYERLRPNGLFNVSLVTAKGDEGFNVIERWKEQCLQKCDTESCGDQKYLDEWPRLLGERLHVFKSLGIGAGPWNAYTYDVYQDGGVTVVGNDLLVFYHFHEFRRDGKMNRTQYPIGIGQARYIYEPYEKHFEEVAKRVNSLQSI